MGNLLLRIAAIERFGPNESRRSRRAPVIVARAGGHAVDRHLIRQGKTRELVYNLALSVPHLDFSWKPGGGGEIRKGTMNGLNQEVLAVGRRRDKLVETRFAYRRDI